MQKALKFFLMYMERQQIFYPNTSFLIEKKD